MLIETNFSIGDVVHAVDHSRVNKVQAPCPTCLEQKTILVVGWRFTCPKCEGRGHLLEYAFAWYIAVTSEVGQVQTCTRTPDEDDPRRVVVKYMLRATGIGSGRVYEEDHLLGGTREEAQAEVDRRNVAKEWP